MTKKKKSFSEHQIDRSFFTKPINLIFFSLTGLVIIFLFYNQFVTLNKFSNLVSPFARWGSLSEFLTFLSKYGSRLFSPADKNVFTWMIIISFVLFIIEIRKKVLQNLIEIYPKTHKAIILAIIFFGIIFLRFYIAQGNNIYRGDSAYFNYLSYQSYLNISNFKFFNFWSFFGVGGVLNQFYSIMHNTTGAIINLFINDIHLSIKLTHLIYRILCGIGVYLFVQELTNSRKAGFISAIVSMLIHQHSHSIIYPGRYSVGAFLGILPFLYYFLERYFSTKKLKNLILMSIFVALSIFAHLKSSFLSLMIFPIYVIARLYFIKKNFLKQLIKIGVFVLIGVLLSSFLVIGFLLETKYADWGNSLEFISAKGLGNPTNPFISYISWNNFRLSLFKGSFKKWQAGYIGLTTFILFLLSFYFLVYKKNRKKEYIPLLIITSIFFIFGFILKANAFFQGIPLLNAIGTERFLLTFTVLGSAAAGLGYLALKKVFNNVNKNFLFLIVLFIILIDLFPTTFQAPFQKDFGGTALPIIDSLKKNFSFKKNKSIVSFRYMLAVDKNSFASPDWRTYDAWFLETEGASDVRGHSVDNYHKLNPFLVTLNYRLSEHLQKDSTIPEYLMNGIFMLNTRYLIAPSNIDNSQFVKTYPVQDLKLCQFKNYSPVIVAAKIKKSDYEEFKREPAQIGFNHINFLKLFKIDYKTKNSDFIIVGDNYKGSTDINHGKVINVDVLDHKVELDKVWLKVNVDSPCFARLSYANYPAMEVKINDKTIFHEETLEGMILVKLDKGENRIEIIPHLTKLRKGLLLFSLILLILVIAVYYKMGNKKV